MEKVEEDEGMGVRVEENGGLLTMIVGELNTTDDFIVFTTDLWRTINNDKHLKWIQQH